MGIYRSPHLFDSARHRPSGDVRPRRGARPARNPRFVPESLERRLTPSDLVPATSAYVAGAGGTKSDPPPPSKPRDPGPLPPPTLPTGPATPY